MKYSFYIIAMAVLTLVWGCSSNDDDGIDRSHVAKFDESAYQPFWWVDMTADQQAPQWTSPDPAQYENKMIILLRLQEELVPYSTDDDLMAVFVGDECRALSRRSGTDSEVYFVLNVHGKNSYATEQFVIYYYSGGYKQLFSLEGENTFRNEMNVGIETEYVPDLMSGSTKYPVKTELCVTPIPIKNQELEESEFDLVGVFVGDECRGVGKPNETFHVYSYKKGEKGTLCYYNMKQGGVFTCPDPIDLSGDQLFIGMDIELQ